MATIEYARIIIKNAAGLPTIPPSPDHDNGDWILTDIYEFEPYVDNLTGQLYTRVGATIVPLPGLAFVTHNDSLSGLGTAGSPLEVALSADADNLITLEVDGLKVGSVALATNLLFKQNTTITHTGTTSETIITPPMLIPGGTLEANDVIEFYAKVFANNNVATKAIKCYLNTSHSLVGATQVSLVNLTNTSVGYSPYHRQIVFKNSFTSQEVGDATASVFSDFASFQAVTPLALDFANDVYIFFTGTLTSIANTCGIRSYEIKINR